MNTVLEISETERGQITVDFFECEINMATKAVEDLQIKLEICKSSFKKSKIQARIRGLNAQIEAMCRIRNMHLQKYE
jgi:hypothetical protein